MKLSELAQKKWQESGYEALTAIQEKSYPAIQAGENIVGISPTGTGKTLAYLLPLVDQLVADKSLQVLILAPSQELAQQIGQEARAWLPGKTQVISGGANLRRQLDKLKEKPEVIVATPGRLLEIANQSKKIKFHQIKTIVIDEADHLLDGEHLKAVRELVKKAPSQRQLLFYSATSNENLEAVTKWFGVDVKVIQADEPKTIRHAYLVSEDRKRGANLKRLAQVPGIKALVFVNNVANLATLYEKMTYEGLKVAALHSQMHHIDRKKAIDALKSGQVQFLLTTDVAARGLDIEDLPYVIQYDLPREAEVYTHRSGRTGRMGKAGTVISFVASDGVKNLKKLVKAEQLVEARVKNANISFSEV